MQYINQSWSITITLHMMRRIFSLCRCFISQCASEWQEYIFSRDKVNNKWLIHKSITQLYLKTKCPRWCISHESHFHCKSCSSARHFDVRSCRCQPRCGVNHHDVSQANVTQVPMSSILMSDHGDISHFLVSTNLKSAMPVSIMFLCQPFWCKTMEVSAMLWCQPFWWCHPCFDVSHSDVRSW